MKVLIKIPTRERPEKFFDVFDLYHIYQTEKDTSFLITLDIDDKSMNNRYVKENFNFYRKFYKSHIDVVYGVSNNKIHAVNRDLTDFQDWDILVLASDDMIPVRIGYDTIIIETMKKYFPDTDGVLYFNDGYTPLNTLPIMGKKYYNKFNYIYNPEYKSFFCDNEFHEVADLLKKQHYDNRVLFRHDHPCNCNISWDELYEKNNKYWDEDKLTYEKHKANNFGVK